MNPGRGRGTGEQCSSSAERDSAAYNGDGGVDRKGGINGTAHGVHPFSMRETHDAELVKETSQKAQVHPLTARLRNDITPAYTTD